MADERIGEVIEASTARFVAECYELDRPPAFGAFVRTTTREPELVVYAIAAEATTESIEPGRRVIARGRDAADPDDVYRQNPQLGHLLHTTFVAIVVGHRDASGLRRYLPPLPARLHGFVSPCSTDEVAALTADPAIVVGLLVAGLPNADELAAAAVREAARHHADPGDFLVAAGKALALALSGSAGGGQRLGAILAKIRPARPAEGMPR